MGFVLLMGFSAPPMPIESATSYRVPGMSESFNLSLCPSGSINTDDGQIEIQSLYVLTTELTWDLYDIYVYKLDESQPGSESDAVSRPSKPYVPPDRGFGHEGYPAIGMTRNAAEGFCSWMSIKTGLDIRLPTANEWAYLATSGEGGSYCCDIHDADSLDTVAWFANNSEHSTHPVGQKIPNKFGLYDMHGNAAEWVMSDTRKPIAYGGGYRDDADACSALSFQKQVSKWNQSDPQIPKSQWWLADCSWVGFRFVIEADSVDPEVLEELIYVTEKTD
jgi:formylglycine-generating enzyme required for sulfatase activity